MISSGPLDAAGHPTIAANSAAKNKEAFPTSMLLPGAYGDMGTFTVVGKEGRR